MMWRILIAKICLRELFQFRQHFEKKMAYEIAINSKCNGYQKRLLSMVNNFMDKETESGVSVNKELAQE